MVGGVCAATLLHAYAPPANVLAAIAVIGVVVLLVGIRVAGKTVVVLGVFVVGRFDGTSVFRSRYPGWGARVQVPARPGGPVKAAETVISLPSELADLELVETRCAAVRSALSVTSARRRSRRRCGARAGRSTYSATRTAWRCWRSTASC